MICNRALALLLVLSLVGGCSTTHTILQRQQQVTRLRLDSDPPGATVHVDQQPRGRTPAEVALTYTLVHKELHPGERKGGWWLLGTGLAATIIGIGLSVWGMSSIRTADPGEQTVGHILAATFGPVGGLYGLGGLIAGIYYLSKFPATIPITELEPRQVSLAFNIPTVGLRTASITPVGQGLPGANRSTQRVRFSGAAMRWEANLPVGLRLTDTSRPDSTIRPLAAGPVVDPVAPGKTKPAGENPRVEALREQGEACYRQRDYACALQRFERAFALNPGPAMRFNVASALDKLGRAALAVRQYRRYLSEAGDTVSPSAVAHIQHRMKSRLPQVAQLQLVVEPGEATITVDGVPLASLATEPTTLGRYQLVLDPGDYRLDLTCPGHVPRTSSVTLEAGGLRTLELKLQRAAGREDEP